jgi:hypothetical protein
VREVVLEHPDRHLQGDEMVLGSVVQVSLEGAPLAVHLGDGPPPR